MYHGKKWAAQKKGEPTRNSSGQLKMLQLVITNWNLTRTGSPKKSHAVHQASVA